jgi:UDP-N-acetylglucosamine--N-acetylmuramyl-(pentapeptide) pyrophosphoryl-undecaprenol N-acetylglucosamine transferase
LSRQGTKNIRLLLTGGGTGGHLFPAIATAEAMCRRFPDTRVCFVGTKRKMDAAGLSQYDFQVSTIHCQGLKGKGLTARVQSLLLLPLALIESLWWIFRFRPHLVVGVGGYVTGPVVLAARMLGRPVLIHEQNSVPGLANRKLGSLVSRVCLSLPGSEMYFPEGRTVLTGNPVRRQILELAGQQPREIGEKVTLLVLGGSLGAHRVNELVVEALTKHGGLLPRGIEVIHQTGSADQEMVRSAYEQAGVPATVAPFFTDMAEVYGKSDLLVSRAGATTLAELAVLGKPAVLIPYPFAADDHQEKNGRYYEAGGGVMVVPERELTGQKLAETLAGLVGNPARLQEMAASMRAMGRPEATERIVAVCLELIGKAEG